MTVSLSNFVNNPCSKNTFSKLLQITYTLKDTLYFHAYKQISSSRAAYININYKYMELFTQLSYYV